MMSSEIVEACRNMSEEQILLFIQSVKGIRQKEGTNEAVEQNQNNENMASYATVLNRQSTSFTNSPPKDPTNTNNTDSIDQPSQSDDPSDPSDRVKPIFLKDEDVFGATKPARTFWLTNVEIYKAIGEKVPAECIKGIQRIREMWRVYMDNEADRLSLLVQGLNLRGRQIPLHSQNPHNPGRLQPDTIRIKVKNVPLSADDGQIHRALTLEGCQIQGLFRERLRVDGKLTNCETGDRLIISKTLSKPIPRNLKIGKYIARVFHSGQPEFKEKNSDSENQKLCHKCLSPDHLVYECKNDWTCKKCKESGHKMIDCPKDFTDDENENQVDKSETDNETEKVKEKEVENKIPQTQQLVGKKDTDKPDSSKSGATKNVTIQEQNKSDKSQSSIEKFMKTPTAQGKPNVRKHTPPTPPERFYDKTDNKSGPKKPRSNKQH